MISNNIAVVWMWNVCLLPPSWRWYFERFWQLYEVGLGWRKKSLGKIHSPACPWPLCCWPPWGKQPSPPQAPIVTIFSFNLGPKAIETRTKDWNSNQRAKINHSSPCIVSGKHLVTVTMRAANTNIYIYVYFNDMFDDDTKSHA
jgi:hypothetical protein